MSRAVSAAVEANPLEASRTKAEQTEQEYRGNLQIPLYESCLARAEHHAPVDGVKHAGRVAVLRDAVGHRPVDRLNDVRAAAPEPAAAGGDGEGARAGGLAVVRRLRTGGRRDEGHGARVEIARLRFSIAGCLAHEPFFTGDFLNTSTQNTLWSTGAATLEFSSTSASATNEVSHKLQLAGVDDGSVSSGFTNNFAWGERHMTVFDLDRRHRSSATGSGSRFTPTHHEASSP